MFLEYIIFYQLCRYIYRYIPWKSFVILRKYLHSAEYCCFPYFLYVFLSKFVCQVFSEWLRLTILVAPIFIDITFIFKFHARYILLSNLYILKSLRFVSWLHFCIIIIIV
jgi:hypothetical protein